MDARELQVQIVKTWEQLQEARHACVEIERAYKNSPEYIAYIDAIAINCDVKQAKGKLFQSAIYQQRRDAEANRSVLEAQYENFSSSVHKMAVTCAIYNDEP